MKYVCSTEVREYLGVTRQRTSKIARDEGWRIKDYDRPHWYNLEDVQRYFYNRNHTKEAREKYNATFVGLLRHDDNGFHKKCPVCKNALTEQQSGV